MIMNVWLVRNTHLIFPLRVSVSFNTKQSIKNYRDFVKPDPDIWIYHASNVTQPHHQQRTKSENQDAANTPVVFGSNLH